MFSCINHTLTRSNWQEKGRPLRRGGAARAPSFARRKRPAGAAAAGSREPPLTCCHRFGPLTSSHTSCALGGPPCTCTSCASASKQPCFLSSMAATGAGRFPRILAANRSFIVSMSAVTSMRTAPMGTSASCSFSVVTYIKFSPSVAVTFFDERHLIDEDIPFRQYVL